jgi:hypothetical protein
LPARHNRLPYRDGATSLSTKSAINANAIAAAATLARGTHALHAVMKVMCVADVKLFTPVLERAAWLLALSKHLLNIGNSAAEQTGCYTLAELMPIRGDDHVQTLIDAVNIVEVR